MTGRMKKLTEGLGGSDSFADCPRDFAARPEHDFDAFSEILRGVALKGAVYFSAEFSAPWARGPPRCGLVRCCCAPDAAEAIASTRFQSEYLSGQQNCV